jgi:hypothetical protein
MEVICHSCGQQIDFLTDFPFALFRTIGIVTKNGKRQLARHHKCRGLRQKVRFEQFKSIVERQHERTR